MTGKDFLDWLDNVKHIDHVEWDIVGDDCTDAEEIRVIVTADGEKKIFYFGSAKFSEYPDECCKIAMAMITNRILEQGGISSDQKCYTMYDDPVDVVNVARSKLLDQGDEGDQP